MKFLRTLFEKGNKQENSGPSFEEEMRQLLNEQSREERNNASKSPVEFEMQQLLKGPGPDEFYTAMLNLQKYGEIVLPRLKGIAVDSTQPSGYRARALETAAMIGGKDIGSFLIQCATDPDIHVRWSAVVTIGKLHIDEALPLLKELLISDNAESKEQGGFVLSMKKEVTRAIAAIESETK